MSNEPYKKVISDSLVALKRLAKDVTELWPWQFAALKDGEKTFKKIESKIRSMKEQLEFQPESFQRQVLTEHEAELKQLNLLCSRIKQELEDRNWLRNTVNATPIKSVLRLVVSINDGVVWLLEMIGLPTNGLRRLSAVAKKNFLPKKD